jgi:hypothetical protein
MARVRQEVQKWLKGKSNATAVPAESLTKSHTTYQKSKIRQAHRLRFHFSLPSPRNHFGTNIPIYQIRGLPAGF